MKCPKCNQPNLDNAPLCSSCGWALSCPPGDAEAAKTRLTKTLRLAVLSLVLGILSIPSCAVTAIPAIILGIISLVKIEKSGGRLTGKGFAVIGITIPAILCSLMGFYSLMAKLRHVGRRLVCQRRLESIRTSMFIYVNDWDDEYPLAGGLATRWGTTPDWQAEDRFAAFGLGSDGKGGQASASASLYTMCRSYLMGGLGDFVCPDDSGTTPFNPSFYTATSYVSAGTFWDFGPDPSKHCSYAYHMPYGPCPLRASSPPAMPVVADRNPWLPTPTTQAEDFAHFDPTTTRRAMKEGNTMLHKRSGQNVVFVDGHVSFEYSPLCGPDGDNIYTSSNGPDIQRGTPPTFESQPADPNDSLLLHDPPRGAAK